MPRLYNHANPMGQSRALFTLAVLLQTLQPAFLLRTFASGTEVPVARKAAPRKDLASQIAAIIAQPQLARADWGIAIADLETGKTIYARNADRLFLPASNAKLLTTSAVMALVGPNYLFRTTVETTGKVDAEGRLKGDLVIVGRGDPNISGRVLPYQLKSQRNPPHTQILEDMANQIAQAGIKTVDGDVIGDDTFYSGERYPEGWGIDDLQWLDGAPVSALTFNDNVVFLKVQPGVAAGDKAVVAFEPQTSYYELDNRILTAPAGTTRKIGMHRGPGSRRILLWGVLSTEDAGLTEAVSIEDPAEFTAEIFRGLLEQRGITVTGKVKAQHGEIAQFFDQTPAAPVTEPAALPAQILALHVSQPLIEDIRVTNKTSQNLHAELDLRLIGKQTQNDGSYDGGLTALKKFLRVAGLKEEEFSLTDGSGLSRRDLITPAAMVRLLIYDAKQPWGPAFMETLPVSGVDGSLTERFANTPAGGLIHAKTGTLSHVSALSGYGETRSGKKFVFSIFCNKINLPSHKAAAAIDQIMQLVVAEGEPAKP